MKNINKNQRVFQWMWKIMLLNVILLSSCEKDECELPEEDPAGTSGTALLDGKWTRIESNNPAADYIQVNVADAQGTITDKAQSSFQLGAVKWKDITLISEGNFSHQELGSDGQYYDASISVVDDSTLEISVGHSGSGNAQKWVRNPPPRTMEIGCSINSETTLINGPSEVDYVVSCVVDITEALIIEPGVVIEFENNAGFGIYDNGSINAVGESANPIVFRGTSGTKGSWRGIHIETNSISNRFEYVTVQDAGSNYVYCCNEKASVFIKGGRFAIENSTIENGADIGLYADKNATLTSFSNVTISTHDKYPMSLALSRSGELDGLNSDFTGNSQDYINILDGKVDNEIVIKANNVPYLVNEVLDIIAGVTVMEGAEFVMRENSGIGIYDAGYLKIQGSSSNKVIIRGYESVSGYWRGIHMETNSIHNDINHAEISEAGSNYVYCCNDPSSIFLKSGKASITNTKISNGKSYGIHAGSGFEFGGFSNNTITSHEGYPMYIAADRIGELDGMESDYSGNTEDFVAVFNSDLEWPSYWKVINVPYLIEDGVIDIKERVEIEKGTEIVFAENAGLGIYDGGKFNAVGTAGENIIFRGKSDVIGFWRGIHIETNSLDNVMDFCQVLNAGSSYVYCCNDAAAIFAKDGLLTVSNSTMEKSGGCGLAINPAANVTEFENTFNNNSDGSICE